MERVSWATGRRARALLALALLLVLLAAALLALPPRDAVAARGEGAPLAVLMYHQLTTQARNVNEHTLTEAAFAKDLELLLERGFTPITAEHLLRYCEGTGYLPEKPVLITFDDGNLSFYRHAYPLLIQYGVPAVLSPVASWVERESKNERPTEYVTDEMLKEMLASGLVELGNHSYDMHNASSPRRGVLKRWNESEGQYVQALTQDVRRAQAFWLDAVGVEPQVFAYPYGFCNAASEDILQGLGFPVTFGCWERINRIVGPESLAQLGRFNRPGTASSDAFLSKIEKLY